VSETWKYLYAIGPSNDAGSVDLSAMGSSGLDASDIEVVVHRDLAAYVSGVPAKKIRPVRKNLAAHHCVLRTLATRTTALPMSFGMIAEDDDEVLALLESRHDDLVDRVHRLAGRVELTLRLKWDVPNVFAMFLESHAKLREARDLAVAQGEFGREAKIQLGELFADLLDRARQDDRAQIDAQIIPFCEEAIWNDPRDETESVSVSALVREDSVDEFEAAVNRVAEQFDDRYVFDFGGPHPPHSFVSVQLSLDGS